MMKIVISPAKTMKEFTYAYGEKVQMPLYQEAALVLYQYMKKMDLQKICSFCKVSEKLGSKCMQDYQHWRIDEMGSPAIFTYQGIQYKALQPLSFCEDALAFANEHVRILSGLYGSVRPLDCIYPYRLEMQAPVRLKYTRNLYEYWQPILLDEFLNCQVIDLASLEYSQVLPSSIREGNQYIRIEFYMEQDGRRKAVSTAIKAARGHMLHEIIKQKIINPNDIKDLGVDGFQYKEALSNASLYVFVKEEST